MPLRGSIITLSNRNTTKYSIAEKDGKFNISICDSQKTVQLKISYIGYTSWDTTMDYRKEDLRLGTKFLLANSQILNEVLVVNKPIEQRGDTTSFNIAAFKNKTDANIEETIKRLPGFDVDANGAIRYNNKPIENILIEGDEMSKNYKLISKNLSPDIIDKLELVDKYNENPVLKNLLPSNQQVINLTLKKGSKPQVYGQLKIGGGIENKYQVQGNGIMIKKQLKSLGIVSANNTGTSPYDEISADNSFTDEKQYEITPLINPSIINMSPLFNRNPLMVSNGNNLFNNSKLFNLGNVFKVSKRTSLTLFSDLYSDKVGKFQNRLFNNKLDSQNTFKELFEQSIKPVVSNNQIKMVTNYKTVRLLILASYKNNRQEELSNIKTALHFISNLNSKLNEWGSGIYFTKRLDTSRAIDISLQLQSNSQKQWLDVHSNSNRQIDIYRTKCNFQYLDLNHKMGKLDVQYYRAYSQKLSISALFHIEKLDLRYTSSHILNDTLLGLISPSSYYNNSQLNSILTKAAYNIVYKHKGFNIAAGLSGMFQSQKTSTVYYIDSSTKFRSLYPTISINYKVSKNATISLNGSFEGSKPDYAYLSANPVLSTYRNFSSDSNFLNQVNGKKIGFNYSFRNIEKATFFIFSYIHYDQVYFRTASVSSTNVIDYSKYFYTDASFNFNNVYTKLDKYIKEARLTVSLKNNSSLFSNPQFFNGIKASSKMLTSTSSINLRPSFIKNVNLNFGAEYYFQKDLLSNKSNYQFKYLIEGSATINNKLSVGASMKNIYSNFFLDKGGLLFGNLHVWYSIKPQKSELKFTINNLFNTREIIYGERNVGFERLNTDRLLPRFALLEWSFKL